MLGRSYLCYNYLCMQTVTFYILTLGLASGVLLRSFLYISDEVLLLGLLMAFGLLVLRRRASVTGPAVDHEQRQVLSVLLWGALGLAALSVGAFRFGWAETVVTETLLAPSVGETVTITGLVVREPDVRAGATLLTVQTTDTRVLVRTDRYSDVLYGDTVAVTGKLEQPEAFVTDLGREFDYEGYLHARGVTHTMSFVTPTVIAVGEAGVLARLYQLKAYFLSRLALVLPEPEVGLGAGLLLGVQSALGADIEEAFRTAGIIHIVVLSGYNIMLVVAFVMYVFAYFLPFRARLICGIGAVIVFALLVGYSPSVLRASLMAILFLLSSLLARPYLILRMLVLAGILMVMWNPYILRYDIGFQLSFMATLGLILVAPRLELLFSAVATKFSMRTFLVATIATQIAVAPLLLYHIGEWSLVAIPVNLLVLPMVPVAMLLTFLTGLVALVSAPLATPLAFCAQLSLMLIIGIAQVASAIPFAAVSIPPFPGYLVPLLYVLLGVVWYRFIYRRSAPGPSLSHPATTALVDEYARWTIVEEDEVIRRLPSRDIHKAGGTIVPPARESTPRDESTVPIFFR